MKNMEKPLNIALPVSYSEHFRIPSELERSLGLWIDRIGEKQDSDRPEKLRILGQYAAVFIESGKGVFRSRTTSSTTVQAGDVMLLFPTEPALYYPHGSWKTHWIVWNGPEAEQLEQLGYLQPNQPVLKDRYKAVSQAYTRLQQYLQQEEKAAALERKAILLHTLHLLCSAQPFPDLTQSHPSLKQAIEYLQTHHTDQQRIPAIARQFGFSASHFRSLFKAYTGRSPREFITALRIAHAKALLTEGKRVKEVAALVGYADEFYFMRVFKTVTGISPGKFAA